MVVGGHMSNTITELAKKVCTRLRDLATGGFTQLRTHFYG